jgi:hypothetical protein
VTAERVHATASLALLAMSFVIDEDVWPAFTKWARCVTSDAWDEDDRQLMIHGVEIMEGTVERAETRMQ